MSLHVSLKTMGIALYGAAVFERTLSYMLLHWTAYHIKES